MRSLPRLLGRCLVVLLLVALVARCDKSASTDTQRASSSAGNPRRGGTAVLGSITDVDSWNEYLSRQSFANDLHRRIWLRLARPRGDGREHPPTYEPELAESWVAADDGRTLTFRLREATWSDGRPVTAADVRFTWTAQVAPEVGWVGASTKQHVQDVVVVDARTVSFRFDRAYPDALADAAEGGILPEHVFAPVPFAQWRTHDWSTLRVGSGPFLLERHAPGEEIDLVRNPAYFRRDLPRLDRVVVRVVPDIENLVTQLQAGAIDYLEGIPPRDAGRLAESRGVRVIPFDEPKYDYIGWNEARPPFDDARVRRALTLAIDREAIVADLLYGFGRVSRGPMLSFHWAADGTLTPWPHDPEAARKLLTEAGFRPGRDGVLERGGKPLAFEITTNAGNRLRESVLVKVQEQLARIGVRVTPRPLEGKTFVQQNVAGKYDAYLSGWRFTGKIDLRSIFHSASVPEAGSNVVSYRSPDADRLIDELDTAGDWRAAIPILHAVQARIREDAPYTFLYETRRIAGARERLQGVEIDVPADPLGRLETYWVEP